MTQEKTMDRHLLSVLGEQTLRAVDVGARGALIPRFDPVAGRTAVFGFEPDTKECERLNRLLQSSTWAHAEVFPYALGRNAHGRPIYMTRNPQLISLLAPNREVLFGDDAEVLEVSTIDTISLDELYRNGALSGSIDFIKLDTQGSELEILKHSENVLADSLGIETEVEFIEAYQEQPRFSEIDLYLRDLGFEPFLVDVYSFGARDATVPLTRRRCGYGDAVFLRGGDWLAGLAQEERSRALRKLTVIYLLYGLFDDALALAHRFDLDIERAIKAYYSTVAEARWYWRLALIRDFLVCIISPTRNRRVRLARRAKTVMARGTRRWTICSNAK
jgi:FkbM family methyltransferase